MTAAIVVKGNAGFLKQRTSGSFDSVKGQGSTYRDEWHYGGSDDSAITTFKLNLETQGYENISVKKGMPTIVTASYPDTLTTGGSSASDLRAIQEADWELLYNLLEQKLEFNPDFQRNAEIGALLAAIETAKTANNLASTDFSATTTANTNNNALRDSIVRGTESFYDYYRVIRQTITTSSKTLIQLAQTNNLKWTSFASIGVPAYFASLFSLEERYQPVKGTSTAIPWLIMPPQFMKITKRKYQIVKEWWEIFPDKYLYLQADETTWPTYEEPNGP